MNELEKKTQNLENILKSYKSLIVSFSGGVDSTLLAYTAYKVLGDKSLAVTINSEFLDNYELNNTKKLAKDLGFNHIIIDSSVFNNPEIVENSALRCKFCKKSDAQELIKEAERLDFNVIADGANIDDLKDYRPGFKASKEYGIKSPFIEACFAKADIRKLAKISGLPNWNKPAAACLASRIPYDSIITKKNLKMLEKAENQLRNLGYQGFRVRHHDNIARIELNPENIHNFIVKHRVYIDKAFKEIGYSFVCLDLNGYEIGSMNKLLKTGIIKC